jgi:hypothetical protein
VLPKKLFDLAAIFLNRMPSQSLHALLRCLTALGMIIALIAILSVGHALEKFLAAQAKSISRKPDFPPPCIRDQQTPVRNWFSVAPGLQNGLDHNNPESRLVEAGSMEFEPSLTQNRRPAATSGSGSE